MNRRYPRYPDDADYQTNSPSYYEDLARKQKLFKILTEKIWEYDDEIKEYFKRWEDNLANINDEVIEMMIQWSEDGTLDHIINDTIFNWKADKTFVDSEIERLIETIDSEIEQVNKTIDSEIEQVNKKIDQVKIYTIEYFGAKCDGITDDTEALRLAGNYTDNAIIKFPANSTTIISEHIDILKNNVFFDGGGTAEIKLKDDSGLLQKIVSGVIPRRISLIQVFGEHSGVKNLKINGNVYENYINFNGENYSALFEPNMIPNQEYSGGYNGIGLHSNNSFSIGNTIKDISWAGINTVSVNPDLTGTNVIRTGIKILENTLTNCGRDAITVHSTIGTEVKRNKIIDTQWHAIHDYLNTEGTIIEDNILTQRKNRLIEMYPNHHNEVTYFPAIIIDHGDYRQNIVTNSRVKNNKIDGDFQFGIRVNRYAKDFHIMDNEINNTVVGGISLGLALGDCVVENNKINHTGVGVSYTISFDYSTGNVYPPSTPLDFNIDIKDNSIKNCDSAYIRIPIRNRNANNEEVLSTHIDNGTVNIFNNDFIGDKIKPDTAILYVDQAALVDKPQINVGENNFIQAFNNLAISKRQQTIYVDSINGDDQKTGSLSEPLKTIDEAIKRLPMITSEKNQRISIRIMRNTSENITILGTLFGGVGSTDTLVIEGHDGTSPKTVEVGRVNIRGLNTLTFRNIKPKNNGGSDFLITRCNHIHIENCELTNDSVIGIETIQSGLIVFINSVIGNKNIGLVAKDGSKILTKNITTPTTSNIDTGYDSRESIIHAGGSLKATNDYKAVRSGLIITDNGDLITST